MNRRRVLFANILLLLVAIASFSAGYLLSSSARYVSAAGTITIYKNGKLLYSQPDAIAPLFNDFVACRLFTTNSSVACNNFYTGNFFAPTRNNTMNSFAAGLMISSDTTPYSPGASCGTSIITTISPVAPALASAVSGVTVMSVGAYPAHTPSITLNATVSATSSFTAAKVCLTVLTLVKNTPSGYYPSGLIAVDLLSTPVSLTSGQTITIVWTWSW